MSDSLDQLEIWITSHPLGLIQQRIPVKGQEVPLSSR